MAPVLKQVYIQMAEPRWVMAVGACASSGGIFDTYSVLQGIDEVIPGGASTILISLMFINKKCSSLCRMSNKFTIFKRQLN